MLFFSLVIFQSSKLVLQHLPIVKNVCFVCMYTYILDIFQSCAVIFTDVQIAPFAPFLRQRGHIKLASASLWHGFISLGYPLLSVITTVLRFILYIISQSWKQLFLKSPDFFVFGWLGFFSGKWYLETPLWVLAALVAPELHGFRLFYETELGCTWGGKFTNANKILVKT